VLETQSIIDRIARAKSRVAVNGRKSVQATPDQIAGAKQELAALKIEAAIAKALKDAPPLSDERAQRIAAILLGGGANDAA